jgi:ATP-dependent exoDNAse (exonuclease V) beta subunit
VEICDYKTDRITPTEREDPSLLRGRMQERHGDQLAQYAAAVEEVFGVRPTKAYIYSLPLGEALEISI